jgi:hypothetical protein
MVGFASLNPPYFPRAKPGWPLVSMDCRVKPGNDERGAYEDDADQTCRLNGKS